MNGIRPAGVECPIYSIIIFCVYGAGGAQMHDSRNDLSIEYVISILSFAEKVSIVSWARRIERGLCDY